MNREVCYTKTLKCSTSVKMLYLYFSVYNTVTANLMDNYNNRDIVVDNNRIAYHYLPIVFLT